MKIILFIRDRPMRKGMKLSHRCLETIPRKGATEYMRKNYPGFLIHQGCDLYAILMSNHSWEGYSFYTENHPHIKTPPKEEWRE